jgi:hypothetical protein
MKAALSILVTVSILLLAASCPPTGVCEPQQTQCVDDVAQLCDPEGRWQDVMNCAEVEGDHTFSCQQDPEEGHTCLPVTEGEE